MDVKEENMKKTVVSNFEKIPHEFMRNTSGLSGSALAVLLCLGSYNPSHPDYDTIMANTGLSRKAVATAIKNLVASGYLTYKKGSNFTKKANQYSIDWTPDRVAKVHSNKSNIIYNNTLESKKDTLSNIEETLPKSPSLSEPLAPIVSDSNKTKESLQDKVCIPETFVGTDTESMKVNLPEELEDTDVIPGYLPDDVYRGIYSLKELFPSNSQLEEIWNKIHHGELKYYIYKSIVSELSSRNLLLNKNGNYKVYKTEPEATNQ